MGSFLSMMNGGALRFVPFTIFKIFAKRCFACYKFNVCCCAVSLYSDYTGAAVIFNDFLCFFKRNIQSALRIATSGGSAFCIIIILASTGTVLIIGKHSRSHKVL